MTAAVTSSTTRMALAELRTIARRRPDWPYLVPVPSCEPPFDDERTAADRLRAARGGPVRGGTVRGAIGQQQRAGRAAMPAVVDAPPTVRPVVGRAAGSAGTAARRLRPVVDPRGTIDAHRAGAISSAVPTWSVDPDVGIRRTPSGSLPQAQRCAMMLARGLVEVLAGVRHPDQLRSHCSPPVFAGLEELPLIPGTGLPKVRSVRVGTPADGVAEVSVVFQRGPRVRALAFRIEGVDGRWRMTALQVA